MAGEGKRFKDAGFTIPKPFIPVNDHPMVYSVVQNLAYSGAKYFLIARREHLETNPDAVSDLMTLPDLEIRTLDAPTEGTACTVLEACHDVGPDAPLLIANADQIIRHGVKAMLDDAFGRKLDGSIMTFRADGDPKWSYAKLDDAGHVTAVAEKIPISEIATTGIYYFKTVRQFVDAAEEMISVDDRVNGEFYTCPVYNYLIDQGGLVGAFEINPNWMHGLGTPDDLEMYINQLH